MMKTNREKLKRKKQICEAVCKMSKVLNVLHGKENRRKNSIATDKAEKRDIEKSGVASAK